MLGDINDRVRKFAQDASTQEGCRLYDLEFSGGQNGRVLRVYIDRDDRLVSIDDCANVSRALNQFLDVEEDVIPGGAYDLEVSSPGLERRLVEPWHFEKVVNQPVRVRTSEMVTGGLTNVTPQTLLDGVLKKVEDGNLVILKDGNEWIVPMSQVAKANVRFVPPEKQGPKGKKKR